jgi:hypothetical protein
MHNHVYKTQNKCNCSWCSAAVFYVKHLMAYVKHPMALYIHVLSQLEISGLKAKQYIFTILSHSNVINGIK